MELSSVQVHCRVAFYVAAVHNCALPDEPKIGGAMPMNSRQSNSIIHQMERGEWKTVDPAGSHHLSKADSDDMLLVLTVHASSKADDACDF